MFKKWYEANKDGSEGGGAQSESDSKTEEPKEHMIPKARLDEVIAEREAARKKLKEVTDAQALAQQETLKEQNKFKELYEQQQATVLELKTKADKVDEYETTLKETLDAQLKDIPEPLRKLVPAELSTRQQLAWLASNKAILLKPDAFDIGAGKGKTKPGDKTVELTAEQKMLAHQYGMSEEDYLKFSNPTPEGEPFHK
jgi:hypothetical protein